MEYEQIYHNSKENYNKLLNQYYEIINTTDYQAIISSKSFSLLKAYYVAKQIETYANAPAGKKPVFEFDSLSEAVSFYNKVINYKEYSKNILNSASLIVSADKVAERLNTYVALSDYLENDLTIPREVNITKLSKECLELIPKCQKELTPEFRINLLKDMLNTFSPKQITVLATNNIIKRDDIESLIKYNTNEKFAKNINILCKGFKLEYLPKESYNIKVKGTTFTNEDGTSRQEYLKELLNYINITGKKPAIVLEKYTYKPEIGNPEPAIRIKWGERTLGHLPKDITDVLYNDYANDIYTVSINNIVGGGKVKYGLDIKLNISEDLNKKKDEPEKNISEESIELV